LNVRIDRQLAFDTSCATGKQCRNPFQKRNPQKICQFPLELVHIDLCGLMKATSMGGTKYFMTFINDNQVWCGFFSKTKIKSFGSLQRVPSHGGD